MCVFTILCCCSCFITIKQTVGAHAKNLRKDSDELDRHVACATFIIADGVFGDTFASDFSNFFSDFQLIEPFLPRGSAGLLSALAGQSRRVVRLAAIAAVV